MAVIVELRLPGASAEQMYAVEQLTQARGDALGRPPYTGCMFIAATSADGGIRLVSAWRTETDFRATMEAMIEPDLASVGLSAMDVTVSPALSMAIPGALGS